jgi:hypothetical protein
MTSTLRTFEGFLLSVASKMTLEMLRSSKGTMANRALGLTRGGAKPNFADTIDASIVCSCFGLMAVRNFYHVIG